MHTTYDIEICDHCGCEFDVGYWRSDLKLCTDCLSLAQELAALDPGAEPEALAESRDDDWDYAEVPYGEVTGDFTEEASLHAGG